MQHDVKLFSHHTTFIFQLDETRSLLKLCNCSFPVKKFSMMMDTKKDGLESFRLLFDFVRYVNIWQFISFESFPKKEETFEDIFMKNVIHKNNVNFTMKWINFMLELVDNILTSDFTLLA